MAADGHPLVSICIPVYNGANYLAEAVESVMAQNHPRLELLIQDNASTDDTPALCEALAARFAPIRVQRNPATVSMPANWNLAINRAQGEFVLLLSHDDLLKPDFLGTCLALHAREPVDVVTTEHHILSDGVERARTVHVKEGLQQDLAFEIMRHNPFSINFSLFRRTATERLKRNGRLFAEPFMSCDYELWLRAALAGLRVYYTPVPLATYRWHEQNLSRDRRRAHRHRALTLLRHRKGLRRRHPWVFRLAIARLLAVYTRNRIRSRTSDPKVLSALLRALV
jgi:glycosyltransferase involved in cell wall biosynthesis